MVRASDEERFYQCLTCQHISDCNLDEDAENERGCAKNIELTRTI